MRFFGEGVGDITYKLLKGYGNTWPYEQSVKRDAVACWRARPSVVVWFANCLPILSDDRNRYNQ